MKCGTCGGAARKTALVYVKEGNRLAMKRACSTCQAEAVPLLMKVAQEPCKCGKRAITCGHCVDRKVLAAKRDTTGTKEIAAKLRSLAEAYKRTEQDLHPDYIKGVLETYENAADLVARWQG